MGQNTLLYALIFFGLTAVAGLVVRLAARDVRTRRLGGGVAIASAALLLLDVALIVLLIVITAKISYAG